MTRGEIYLYNRPSPQEKRVGPLSKEQVVIVSSNIKDAHNYKICACYLYRNVARDLPTHATVRTSTGPMIATCEHIRTIPVDDLGALVGRVTPAELAAIDIALAAALGLDFGTSDAKEREELAAALVAQKEEAEQLRRALIISQDTVSEQSDQISELSEELTGQKFRADMLRAEVSELRSELEAAHRENERLSETLGELETARLLHDATDTEIERARAAVMAHPLPLEGAEAGEAKEPPAVGDTEAREWEQRVVRELQEEAAAMHKEGVALREQVEEVEASAGAEIARLDALLLKEQRARARERAEFEKIRAKLEKEAAVNEAISGAVSEHNVDLLNIITALTEREGREG